MNPLRSFLLLRPTLPLLLLLLLIFSSTWSTSSTAGDHNNFLLCLGSRNTTVSPNSDLIHTPNSASYSSVFQFSIRNTRFNDTAASTRPTAIITPKTISQVQSAVVCARTHDVQVRVRSGGHDFEGMSYVSTSPSSTQPFLLIDLINLRNVAVDVPSKSAWVQAGAVLGEVYHGIASASGTLAFPAGICPTVGVGGHVSGGGYGMLIRKHGIAADNVLDAQLVDARGRVLDRAAMGEDVFWAIRGGGGNTYGIVVSWKINLVTVPARLTAFTAVRTSEENVTRVFDRFQHVVDKLPDDLSILLTLRKPTATMQAVFQGLYVGETETLLGVMKQSFPGLELTGQDCREMSWIQSILYFAGYPNNATYDELLDSRSSAPVQFDKVKAKSDYVEAPLPVKVLQGIWKRLYELESGPSFLQIIPHGGMMSRISDSSIPYPHRAGNVYKIQYYAVWSREGKEVEKRYLDWIRRLYEFTTPYVSKNPRGAYVNSRDLDLGRNNLGKITSYRQARIWGEKYYKHNFERLARAKAAIDPSNFFRNEQSVPPFTG
ncbi:unnamed protein product [Linum tenue]|uniref:FAD-binding PCMH-type domain-containing protein n=1 Tax=Linum tenue TaxID=586396 RepID=A0AAV0QK67_9ROSI|nr:unnamed protein product [Linum tenue]